MTRHLFRLLRTLAPLPCLASALDCGGEAAGGADVSTDPTTSGSPTSFTPTSSDAPITTENDESTFSGDSDGPSGPAVCGDGVVESDEECDDGASNGASADCTDDCKVHVCGDGKVHAELEECDDGAENAASADCTDDCRVHMCGDGKVHAELEQCDDGAANVDTGACRSDCVLNICGDGLRHDGVEECDYGGDNGPIYGGCDATCTVNRCGDGELDEGHEQCDDGEENGSGGPGEGDMAGCGLDCGFAGRRLFLSSKLFTGDMGSRAGADLACQNMAEDAGFLSPKEFRAVLADSKGSPNTFLAGDVSGLPFISPNGQILAASYAVLVDQGPGQGVSATETGELVMDALVWTNVGPFGDAFLTDPAGTCADWTSGDPMKSARVGLNAVGVWDLPEWQAGHQWFSYSTMPCKELLPIYCVEAP